MIAPTPRAESIPSVRRALRRSFRAPIDHPRILVAWGLPIIGTAYILMASRLLSPFEDTFALAAVQAAVTIVAMLPLSFVLLRAMVLGRDAPSWDGASLRRFVLLETCLALAPALLLAAFLLAFFGETTTDGLLILASSALAIVAGVVQFVLFVVWFVVCARFVFAFPAVSAGRPLAFGTYWRMTRGMTMKLLLALLVMSVLLAVVIGLLSLALFELFAAMATSFAYDEAIMAALATIVAGTLGDTLMAAVGCAFCADLYRQHRDADRAG